MSGEFYRALFEKRAAVSGEITADPRTVRARFQRHSAAGKLRQQLRQGGAGVR